MDIQPRLTSGANVIQAGNGWRLEIPTGLAGFYRLAQLDDYATLPRSRFPLSTPTTLSLRCRVSEPALAPSPSPFGRGGIPGTWGFGFWNDPFAVSLGLQGMARRLPVLPNAAWFFHASEENYLSLTSGVRRTSPLPANGFLAQTFSSQHIPSGLLALGALAVPLLLIRPLSKRIRTDAGKIIREDAKRLEVDITQWHAYKLRWSPLRVEFAIDGENIFETEVSPQGPLGLVIWIDNQFMAWRPDGSLRMGALANPNPARMEIEQLEVKSDM
jgi:hypothetical protein